MFATGMIAALAILPTMASAQLTPDSTGLSKAAQGTGLVTTCSGTACLLSIIGNVINLALGFLGVVLLALILYGGFLWMTSGGDTKGVEKAQIMIRNAVAGAVIVAASYAISAFVLGQLAVISSGGATTPTGAAASGSVANGGACTDSAQCSDPLATCTGGVCTSVVAP